MNRLAIVILSASIVFQVAAAVVALASVKQTGGASAWIGLSIALWLMSTRRFISLVGHYASPSVIIDPVAESVALLISVLMLASVIGLKGLVRHIRNHETQLTADLDSRETLLREVHHRIKNHMATVSSLLSLQVERAHGQVARTALTDARARIDSMMVLYDELYRSSQYRGVGLAGYVEALVRGLFEAYRDSAGRIELAFHLCDAELSPTRAQPLGIVVNELVTNSLKHAFPDGRPGHIVVSLAPASDGVLKLTICDDGIGSSESGQPGFGLELVEHLVEQVNGTVETTIDRGRTTTIAVPVDRAQGLRPSAPDRG